MKNMSTTIKYKEKEFKLVFDLNVMELIQEEYGSIEKWGAKCGPTKDSGPSIKAIKFGFAAMLNEGIDIDNEDNNLNEPHLTLNKVGRIISEIGINETASALNKAVIQSTKSLKNELSTKK